MSAWPYSTASARSVVLKPFWWPPWHKSVWGWGYAVFELICATKPFRVPTKNMNWTMKNPSGH
ncbi:hypothetical protein, partial [Paracidovorax anthurii]|uniref:hypothetical protein n=1 Tax=Paracidovorax anthurii TaxID=78229 RepID=UPI0039F063D0